MFLVSYERGVPWKHIFGTCYDCFGCMVCIFFVAVVTHLYGTNYVFSQPLP